MGGVDLLDQGVNNYRIGIRGKRWWWVLFTEMLNIAAVNAWRIYEVTGDSTLGLLAFRIITRHYLRLGGPNSTVRRAPASVAVDVVFDKDGHFPYKLDKQLRCHSCHQRAKWACEKCNLTLCLKHGCFRKFHESNFLGFCHAKSPVYYVKHSTITLEKINPVS